MKQIIREEIEKQQLSESLSKADYELLKTLIRSEIAAVMFDLFKKKSVWV